LARRFTSCERPNLLLHDAARLCRILTNPQRPAQLVLAGKPILQTTMASG